MTTAIRRRALLPRRPRPTGGTPLAILLMGAAVTTACGDGAPPAPATTEPTITQVDGVRVVENHAPQWAEGEGWRITAQPVLTLGVDAGDEAKMFTYPRPMRLADGTILVADWGKHELRAFDSAGTHQWTAGGVGQGPGEFESIANVIATPGGQIVVTDGYKPRVTVFTGAGEFVRAFDPVSQQENPRYYPDPMIEAAFGDGSLLALAGARDGSVGAAPGVRSWRPSGVWRYSADGAEVELLVELDFYETIGESHGAPVPFETLSWVHPHAGGFYFVNGRRPHVEDYSMDGTLRSRFVVPREPVPVTAEDRERWLQKSLANYEEAGQELTPERRDGMVYPETMPTWRNALVDGQGNIWIERFLGLQHARPLYWGSDLNSDPFFPVTDSVWDVLTPEGTWLGAVELLPDETIRQIGDTWILTTSEGDDGVARVFLYDLIKR